MPTLVWCKSICGNAYLGCHDRLELGIGHLEEREQFPDQNSDVALVDECETQIQSSPPDTDIRVSKTIKNGIAMTLDSIGLDGNDFDESVQSDIANVVVLVCQELSEDVDAQDSQTR